jgi:hypothetical protein
VIASVYPLPFFPTPDLLPAPLPTPEAITTSQDVIKEFSSRRIVHVGIHLIVKYGIGVDLVEGENMLFVKQFSNIPVPNVYAFYSSKNEGTKPPVNYIVMGNIAGESLESHWASLDDTAKLEIADQLRKNFSQLRQIPSPGYFGILGKRPFTDYVFWDGYNADADRLRGVSGLFDSEQQMLDAIKISPQLPKASKI